MAENWKKNADTENITSTSAEEVSNDYKPTVGVQNLVNADIKASSSHQIVLSSTSGETYTVAMHPFIVGTTSAGQKMYFDSGANQIIEEVGVENEQDIHVVEVSGSNAEGTSACLVCGDHGSGYHYSVYSCEGCKGFFKRTVQKNMSYACKESGLCQINKFTRNSCQHCRFRRCLDVGMRKEAVREDRTPGGKHRIKKMRFVDGSELQQDLSNAGECVTSEEDESLIQQLIDAKPDLIPGPTVGTGEMLDPNGIDVNEMMQFGYLELRYIIEWAKKVPGFGNIQIEDQMALLKSSFMELSILRLAFRSLDCRPDEVQFGTILCMTVTQCKRLGWGEELTNSTVDFIARLRGIDMDLTEFCILNAIVLTYPDASGLSDREAVFNLQTSFLNLLQKYSTTRYPDTLRRFARILLRLLALRTVSAKAAEKFLSFTLEGDVQMTSLVVEMMT